MTTVRKVKRSTLKNKCDTLWSQIVRTKGFCEVCGATDFQLHAHHYIGRTNLRLRWDLRNGICLCATHHGLGNPSAETDPEWFRNWMLAYRKDDFEHCNAVKNEYGGGQDYELVYQGLLEAQRKL